MLGGLQLTSLTPVLGDPVWLLWAPAAGECYPPMQIGAPAADECYPPMQIEITEMVEFLSYFFHYYWICTLSLSN